jgi:thiamine transport system substrate-binding protein
MHRTPLRTLAATAAIALLVTACGGTDEPRSLTLLTHDSFDVSTDVLEAFTAETGITVDVVPIGDAGSALNRVILTADDPEGDLLFGVDTTFLTRALDADIFLPYRSDLVDLVDPSLVPSDPRVTPIDFGDVCVNYDVAWFEASELDVPRTLEQLVDPRTPGSSSSRTQRPHPPASPSCSRPSSASVRTERSPTGHGCGRTTCW